MYSYEGKSSGEERIKAEKDIEQINDLLIIARQKKR